MNVKSSESDVETALGLFKSGSGCRIGGFCGSRVAYPRVRKGRRTRKLIIIHRCKLGLASLSLHSWRIRHMLVTYISRHTITSPPIHYEYETTLHRHEPRRSLTCDEVFVALEWLLSRTLCSTACCNLPQLRSSHLLDLVALALEGHNSPDSVLEVFRKQAQAFDKFRNGYDKLMTWLTPIITILFTFSATLGEGISLVSFHFSCISAMLSQPFNVQSVSHSLPQRQCLLESGSFSG